MSYTFRTSPPEFLLKASDLLQKSLQILVKWIVVGEKPPFSAFEEFNIHLAALPSRLGGLDIPFPSGVLQSTRPSVQIDTCHLQGNLFPSVAMSLA